MGKWSRLIGTSLNYFRLGFTGPRLMDSSGNLTVKHPTVDTEVAVSASRIDTSYTSVASSASTSDIWNVPGNLINWTGTASCTGFATAPKAGLVRDLICQDNCSFTAGANLLIDNQLSGETVLCYPGDTVTVRALSTTQFKITIMIAAHLLDSDTFNYLWSATSFAGFGLTNNGDGTVNIAAGEVTLRIAATETSRLRAFSMSAVTNVSLTNNSANYIIADYNAGTPQLIVGTSLGDFNCMDKCLLWKVVRVGTTLKYIDARDMGVDANRKHRRILFLTERFRYSSGCLLSETGTRNIIVTAGLFFWALSNDITVDAVNTSTTGTFVTAYRNGSGGHTRVTGQTQIDNTYYDDGTGTLAEALPSKYLIRWIYVCLDTPSVIYAVYGTAYYNTLAEAEVATTPSDIPIELNELGVLIGRIIIQKAATSFTSVETTFNTLFVPSTPTTHNTLAGLEGGSPYIHLTTAEMAKLDSDLVGSIQTITPADNVTIDVSLGATSLLTLNRATTNITLSNPTSGQVYRLVLTQSGGSRLISFVTTIKWAGGSAPTLTTTDTKVDIITLLYAGTTWYGSATLNF